MLIPFEARVIGLGHVKARDRQAIERADFETQSEETDETLGMTLIIDILLTESGEVFAVKTERRLATRGDDVAFVKFEAHRTSHRTLCSIDERVNRFSQRCEPETVISKLCIFHRDHLLEVHGLAVKDQRLEFAMSIEQNGAARSFVDTMRFHANQTILNKVNTPDAVCAANGVKRLDNFCR